MNALTVKLKNQKGIELDIDLQCAAGQVLALIGPSGSGKTTILRAIAGLIKTDQGQIQCGDQIWLDHNTFLSPQKRHVGLVFQDYALFPHLTVEQNIGIGMPADQRHKETFFHIEKLLQKVNLSGLEKRMPKTLSGGQQQRVALARALAREPKVLLLDEPFSAVDQVTRRKLRLELLELIRGLKIPIILVTHDLDEATLLADQIQVIHNGHGLQNGTPEQILRAPNSALVARLMDVRNIFEGSLISHQAAANISTISWADYPLEANHQALPLGPISWSIAADKVLLHQRIRRSNGERENPISGTIIELVKISGMCNLIITVDNNPKLKIHMDLPPHVVDRNQLKIGESINMSLLKDAIHLMPYSHSNSK